MARRATNYPPELRERAVRMVAEVRPEHPSDWPAIVDAYTALLADAPTAELAVVRDGLVSHLVTSLAETS